MSHLESDSKSVRVNVRVPRRTYELMKEFGNFLGIESDSSAIKHFLRLGLQAAAGGISAIQSVQTGAETLKEVKKMNESVDRLERL